MTNVYNGHGKKNAAILTYMPNQRSTEKDCIAAWLDSQLVADWKKLCQEKDVTLTDRLRDLLLQDLQKSGLKESPQGNGKSGLKARAKWPRGQG